MKNQRNVLLALALLAVGMPLVWHGGPASAQIKSEAGVRFNQKVEAVTTFTVTNTTLSGAGSLQQAMLDANGNAGADTINFNIPASDPNCNGTSHVCTITLTSALPTITDPVTINGYSQPGSSANTHAMTDADPSDNAVPLIELAGPGPGGPGGPGLFITAGNSTVRGLVINRFHGSGILLASNGNVVAGNFIGTSAAGDANLGNTADGVEIDDNIGPIVDTSNNTVGGTSPADRNLISGNSSGSGVHIIKFGQQSNVTGNKVLGNLIGTDKTGTSAIGNGSGIRLEGVAGANVTGNLIGGTTAAARNVISGNTGSAQILLSGGVVGTSIQGNFIGTDVTGTVPFTVNSSNGVNLSTGSSNTLIGGDDAADGIVDGIVGAANVISGYPGGGAGVVIDGGSSGNHVEGNQIGTNALGTTAIPNGIGVLIGGASGNFVGGAAAGAGNLISSSSGFFGIGVFLRGNSDNNVVQGNRIGTDATGANPLSNTGGGVEIIEGSDNNLIGGTGTGEGNVIAFNLRGVGVGSGTGNSILGNSMFSNSQLGIDLGEDGVTMNDSCDGDGGANNLQNYPLITNVLAVQGLVSISGTLNSAANTTFRLEFFSNTLGDPSGSGEGKNLLGSTNVTTDGTCNASFSSLIFNLPNAEAVITATATRLDGSLNPIETSEFSAFVVAPTAAPVTISGRARTADGRSVYGARISLIDQDGNVKTAISNPFGYFRFYGVAVGRAYLIAAKHKVYQFPTRGISVTDNIVDLELVADPLEPE